MQDKRQVSDDEILERASTQKCKYFITSALDGSNVNEAFQEMGRQILNKSSNEEKNINSMLCYF
jgi:GTPase SAR1 family protein